MQSGERSSIHVTRSPSTRRGMSHGPRASRPRFRSKWGSVSPAGGSARCSQPVSNPQFLIIRPVGSFGSWVSSSESKLGTPTVPVPSGASRPDLHIRAPVVSRLQVPWSLRSQPRGCVGDGDNLD
jgi:hypothetical protein